MASVPLLERSNSTRSFVAVVGPRHVVTETVLLSFDTGPNESDDRTNRSTVVRCEALLVGLDATLLDRPLGPFFARIKYRVLKARFCFER